MDRSRVVLAEVIRPRGNRGEVLARSQTDVPGRLEALRNAWIHLPDGSDRAVDIESVWHHKGNWVVKVAGVDSISEAEELTGADLWVPAEHRAKLGEGEFFQSDLVGCSLVDATSGRILGQVEGWQEYGGPPLMEATVGGREVLVPFVAAICSRVDLDKRTIEVDLPDGLLEL